MSPPGVTAPNELVRRQYSTSEKLAARARLHRDFSVDETPWFPWVAAKAELKAGDRVLDIGCGPGWFWPAAAAVLPGDLDITLCDLSPGMIEEAVPRVASAGSWTARGEVADLGRLPFADASFDAVIAMHMLYHLPAPAAGIAEIHRVLKPGGTAVVTTNGANNLRELYSFNAAAFGTKPEEPVSALFGFAHADSMLRERFGNVAFSPFRGQLRITDPDTVFAAQTSFPPGDTADEAQLAKLREAINAAFAEADGVLVVEKDTGVFVCRKRV
jgi:SAM-dependent methyltransferase